MSVCFFSNTFATRYFCEQSINNVKQLITNIALKALGGITDIYKHVIYSFKVFYDFSCDVIFRIELLFYPEQKLASCAKKGDDNALKKALLIHRYSLQTLNHVFGLLIDFGHKNCFDILKDQIDLSDLQIVQKIRQAMQRAYCNHDFDLFSSLFELHVTHARPYISVLESLNISTLSFGQLDEERLIPPDFEGPSEDFLQTNQFSALTTWQPIDINPLVHPRLAELNGFEEVNPGLENDLFEYAELEDAIEELPQIEDNTTNVHEGQRDFLTAKAWSLLIENQSEDLLPQTQCLLEIRSFIKSLDDEESQAKALNAFEGEDVQLWPSLIDDTFYIAHYDEAIMGLEVAQRLWTFVCNLEEEKEIINAKYAFVSALKASIENGYRVCNPGKLQRLIVAVLSGRLKGADIDGGTSVSKEMAVGMFFSIESNQSIDDKETLIDSAEAFLSQNPLIDRSTFLEEINRFVDYSF